VPRFIAVTSFSGGSIIGVRLINLSGRTVASYRGTGISSVTTSNTEVYFLIGLKEVRFLTPSGAGGRLADLPSIPNETSAHIAVSPDDATFAYGLVAEKHSGSNGQIVTGSRAILGTETPSGTHRRVFLSLKDDAAYRWPVAWHLGAIVVELELPSTGYELLNPQTGAREAALCPDPSGSAVSGPLTPHGVACERDSKGNSVIGFADWSSGIHVYSTDKRLLGICVASLTGAAILRAGTPDPTYLISKNGAVKRLVHTYAPIGWVSDSRLLAVRYTLGFRGGTNTPGFLSPTTETFTPISIPITNSGNIDGGIGWGGSIPATT
jgi:hypothetical protein